MNERIYFGCKTDKDPVAYVMDAPYFHVLPLRLDLRNHSPAGPNWGYGGSGPAQLSLAICAHVFGDDALALEVYQDFKRRWTSQQHGPTFEITASEVIFILSDLALKLTGNLPQIEGGMKLHE